MKLVREGCRVMLVEDNGDPLVVLGPDAPDMERYDCDCPREFDLYGGVVGFAVGVLFMVLSRWILSW